MRARREIRFTVERLSPLPAEEAWRRVTDWERHTAYVPLTTVAVTTPPPTGPGTRVVARTGRGPVAFTDPMEVVEWRPAAPTAPGLCRIVKRGRVLGGRVAVEVHPDAAGSRVVWTAALHLRALPAALAPPATLVARRLYGRLVDGLLGAP
ncbi:SRPBCC family protein [Streptomyces sp. NPDC049555]|uniref:SRPBCC family protein n=1 Tax=Streptomyces sp. NPDC049555 TaxID=3154930 RepID=UPI0034213070